MSRYFAPITKDEFLQKWNDHLKLVCGWNQYAKEGEEFEPNDYHSYYPTDSISKDIKIIVDFENCHYQAEDNLMNYPCGYKELPNGMHCMFLNAGGDWEYPVCIVLYWDGKKMRAYIPKAGNAWNRRTKTAFGSEGESEDCDGDPEEIKTQGFLQFAEEAKHWVSKTDAEAIDTALKQFDPTKEYDFSDLIEALTDEKAIIDDVMHRILKK